MAHTSRIASSESTSDSDWIPQPLTRLHYTNPLLVAASTAIALGGGHRLWSRYLRRIPNADSITQEYLQRGRALRGVVTSVGDADNFRLYHKPLLSRAVPTSRADLKDQTIHVRLAGVDAPELAHFGKPAQPYAAEALDWLTKAVHGRTVKVQLLRKDRYGRVVGMVQYRPFPYLFRRNVSEDMLKAGFATVYTQGGAEHGGLLARFQQHEATARKKKLGMWAQSANAYESPADYKKRTAKE